MKNIVIQHKNTVTVATITASHDYLLCLAIKNYAGFNLVPALFFVGLLKQFCCHTRGNEFSCLLRDQR